MNELRQFMIGLAFGIVIGITFAVGYL